MIIWFIFLLLSPMKNSYQVNVFLESNFENAFFEGAILKSLAQDRTQNGD